MDATQTAPGPAKGLDGLFPDLPTVEGYELQEGKRVPVRFTLRGLTMEDMFALLRIAKHAVVWGSIEAGTRDMPNTREKLIAMLIFGVTETAGPAAEWLGSLIGMSKADMLHQQPRFVLRLVRALQQHPDFNDFFEDLAAEEIELPEWAKKIWATFGSAPSTESNPDTAGQTEQ